MPILGKHGKVLCVKLSVVLQVLKDTELYKKKGEKDMPIITNEEITSLQEFEAKKIPKLATELKNDIEKKIPQFENKSDITESQKFDYQKIEELKSTLKNNNKYASGQHNVSNEVSNEEHSNDVSKTKQQEQSENSRTINKVLQREVENIDKPTPSNQESQWWNPLTWNCNCCNNASQINSEEQAEKELIPTN